MVKSAFESSVAEDVYNMVKGSNGHLETVYLIERLTPSYVM